MANVDLNLSALSTIIPSNAYILLFLLFSVLLLTLIRTAFLFATSPIQAPHTATPDEKGQLTAAQGKPEQSRRQRRIWGLTWESLPLALPVSLTVTDKTMAGVGVGLAAVQSRTPRRGPAFEAPLPAIYQTGPPMSMAKMIMSRHTFRRPQNRPPALRPKLTTPTSINTPSTRLQSMV